MSTILALGSPPGWGGVERPLLPCTPPGPAASAYARSKAAGDEAVLRMTRGSPHEENGVFVQGGDQQAFVRAVGEVGKVVPGPSDQEGLPGTAGSTAAHNIGGQGAGAAQVEDGQASIEQLQGSGVGEADVAGNSGAAVAGAKGGKQHGQGQEPVGRRLPACVVCLGCVVGADPRLLQPEADVMRIADLVRGKVRD